MPPQRTEKQDWTTKSFASKQTKRGPWNTTEDNQLRELVQDKGAGKWVAISDALQTRTPKQCRERWHQNLKPDLNHEPITDEEGRQIEELVLRHGKKWADIARMLHRRSDNAVKNWWNGGENRRKREQARQRESIQTRVQQQYQSALGNSLYPYHQDSRFDFPRLPPIRDQGRHMQINIPDPRHHIESGEPSPLTAQPPSLVSDAETETSLARGHSHRHSFNLPTPSFTAPIHMGRTYSSESCPSPDQAYHSWRYSHRDEGNAIVRTGLDHGDKSLPPIEVLAGDRPQSTGGQSFPQLSPIKAGSVSPRGPDFEGPKLAPLLDTGRQTGSPEDSKSRMSVGNILSR